MAGPRTIRNLALAGFMGTGKSSVGQLVAQELGFEFVDTDAMIEARTGRKISDIFTEAGEGLFRRIETELIGDLATRSNTVISTGGGLIVNPANLASLKSHALVACLWATPATILERTREHTHRPLLQDPDPLAKIRQLLAHREKAYKQADLLINTESRSIREVAQHVLHQFRQAREKSG